MDDTYFFLVVILKRWFKKITLKENRCRMKARNWTSTMVTAVDLDLPASPGVNFSDTGSE